MSEKKVEQSQSRKLLYRLETDKNIEINRSHFERKKRALTLKTIAYALFGRTRYENIYLSCSLNGFYNALLVANTAHSRVEGLAMIIKFETVKVTEYYQEEIKEGGKFLEKQYSRITIKLTKNPTEFDKKQPGYNPGLTKEKISQPLTEPPSKFKGRNNDQRKDDRNKDYSNYKKYGNNQQKRTNNYKKEYDGKKNQRNRDQQYKNKRPYRGDHYDPQENPRKRQERKTRGYNKSNYNSGRERETKQQEYRREEKYNQRQGQSRGDRRPRRQKGQSRYEDD